MPDRPHAPSDPDSDASDTSFGHEASQEQVEAGRARAEAGAPSAAGH